MSPEIFPVLIGFAQQELKLYARGLDAAQKAAGKVVVFLTQRYLICHISLLSKIDTFASRAGKGKATKSSNEAEYRIILDTLISDVLTVLYLPEWPAAALLLGIATRLFVSRTAGPTKVTYLTGPI
jgi:cohesin loading factor subunit SCC2